MARDDFWSGFSAGAAAGIGSVVGVMLAVKSFSRVREGRVVRLEKSLQVGRPVEEVFATWSQLENLPRFVDFIDSVERRGNYTHWAVNLAGRRTEWDAEITQEIPNEAIGWKSVSGPKHTGRIAISPIGTDTLVHVTMNYAPPMQLGRLFSPVAEPAEYYIERALRAFKAALEGKGQEGIFENARFAPSAVRGQENLGQRATGTYGSGGNIGGGTGSSTSPSNAEAELRQTQPEGGSTPNPVDYKRPPEGRY